MENKTKLYGILLLSLFLTTFFIGYSIGYQRGELFAYEWVTDTIKKEIANYSQETYEPIYVDPWWDANWTNLIIDNDTQVYYTNNCTENQVNEFIKQNYTYKEFGDCYIWRYD